MAEHLRRLPGEVSASPALRDYNTGMSTIKEFRCEICGTVTSTPTHWFIIQCNATELKLMKWNDVAAIADGARHFCGEAHAQVYISRWLEAACSPSKPDFNRATAK